MDKIIVADDKEENLLLLNEFLQEEGYEVTLAKNGAEGLQKALAILPSAIISDILMPQMDGFTFCRECKKHNHLKEIPFIFFTANYTDTRDKSFALSLGADRFIAKPVELQLLANTLSEVIAECKRSSKPPTEEEDYLKGYSEVLNRKLTDKTLCLQSIFDTTASIILLLSPEYQILELNRAAEKLYGIKKEKILGQNYLQFTPEKIRGKVKKVMKQVLTGQTVRDFEREVITLDGKKRIVNWNIDRMIDAAAKVIGIVISGTDVTERKKAEQALEEQRTRSIRMDRLNSLGEMAAGIAHDLNQPLSGVRGLAEQLLLGMERGWQLKTSKVKDKLKLIVQQADRMNHVIERVRIFVREAGKPELKSVDLNEVVLSSVKISARQSTDGAEIKTELAGDIATTQANPFSLEEVIANLLANARYAISERVKISPAVPPQILLRTGMVMRNTHPCLQLQVIDNGSGIDKATLKRVFEPFFTTKENAGTGLGLAICRSIVETFAGTIEVQSQPDMGTTVTVLLPADQKLER